MFYYPTPANPATPADIIAGRMAYVVNAEYPDCRVDKLKITLSYMRHRHHPKLPMPDSLHCFDFNGMKQTAGDYNLEISARGNRKARKNIWVFMDLEAAEKFRQECLEFKAAYEAQERHDKIIKSIPKRHFKD